MRIDALLKHLPANQHLAIEPEFSEVCARLLATQDAGREVVRQRIVEDSANIKIEFNPRPSKLNPKLELLPDLS